MSKMIAVEEETWWSELDGVAQTWVRKDAQLLALKRMEEGANHVSQGEILARLQSHLEPIHQFLKFISKHFDISRATAYRRIALYKDLSNTISPTALKVVLLHGRDNLPVEQLKKLPKGDDTKEITAALDKILVMPKPPRVHIVEEDPRTILREMYNFNDNRLSKLPQRLRIKIAKELCSMVLARVGCVEVQKIAPKAAPEQMVVKRGRPKRVA